MMKKIFTVALCAAMLLSMAGVSYSADGGSTNSSSPTIQVLPAQPKPIKPVARVTEPDIPEDAQEQYDFLEANQASEAFIESMQEFGAKTSSMVLTENGTNQTYSPISFAYALGVLGSGASGQTSRDIAKALESTNMKVISNGLNKFYNSNYSDDEGNVLKIANSLWLQEDYPIKEEFAKKAAEQFYASAYSVDFSEQATADAMAKWISEQTSGLLNPTFQANPDQILSIINTLYFEGAWVDSFDAANNTEETFTLEDGSEVDATYMNRTFQGATYYETDDYTLFEVPFEGGQTMKFVLPKEGNALEALLDQQSLEQILSEQEESSVRYADVNLKLPKFSFDSEFDLNETCKALGLEELLEGKADLSGITDERVALSSVKQESHVEVDENGCKAAAYTKMDLMRMSMPVPMEQYDFSLDRPFLFVIESQDEAPLFVGTVYNPLQ